MAIEINAKELKKARKEAARREKVEAVKAKFKGAIDWCNNNKEILILLVPAAVTCVTATTKFANKHINLVKEEKLKDLYCYDRSLGHYWALRRELTNSEWLEIDARKAAGERLSDILESMKVLK